MPKAAILVLAGVAGLAACAPVPRPLPVVTTPPAGLEAIIGKPPAAALALLGTPGLDRSDGTGHHLQFVRAGCILDLYYYPDAAGVSTLRFADARRPDGSADTPPRCFAAQRSG